MAVEENKILDLNISGIKKTSFRINGDNDAILELNLSDLGIMERLENGYKNLQEIVQGMSNISDKDDNFMTEFKKADKKMREQLDYIFDSNVSEVCGKGGTMYDLKDGEFRFESILNALTSLYANNLNEEYKKMKARIQKHTGKYTKSGKSGKRG